LHSKLRGINWDSSQIWELIVFEWSGTKSSEFAAIEVWTNKRKLKQLCSVLCHNDSHVTRNRNNRFRESLTEVHNALDFLWILLVRRYWNYLRHLHIYWHREIFVNLLNLAIHQRCIPRLPVQIMNALRATVSYRPKSSRIYCCEFEVDWCQGAGDWNWIFSLYGMKKIPPRNRSRPPLSSFSGNDRLGAGSHKTWSVSAECSQLPTESLSKSWSSQFSWFEGLAAL
jgi:hypothetical protein